VTDNYAHFDQVTSFESVQVGQYFIEVLSPFNIVYHKVERFQNGCKIFNAQQVKPGQARFNHFYGWEPVRVCGVRQDVLVESGAGSEQV
jgi:hypothetical protein